MRSPFIPEEELRDRFTFAIPSPAVRNDDTPVKIAFRLYTRAISIHTFDKKHLEDYDVQIAIDVSGKVYDGEKVIGEVGDNFIKAVIFENVLVVLYPNKVGSFRLFFARTTSALQIAHEFTADTPDGRFSQKNATTLDICINEAFKTVFVLYSIVNKQDAKDIQLGVRVFPYLIDNSSFDPSPMGLEKHRDPPKYKDEVILSGLDFHYSDPCSFYSSYRNIYVETTDGSYKVEFQLSRQ
jgi:hypothetical protein